MMDLLKRFEEDSLDDGFANGDDEEEGGGAGDDDDLERRLEGINLGEFSYALGLASLNQRLGMVGSASADNIWAVLTPEERARFTRAVQDPASELAKTLLSSPGIADHIPTPWWEAPSTSSTPHPYVPASRPAQPPDVMALPEALLATPAPSPPAPTFPLAYNLVAIL